MPFTPYQIIFILLGGLTLGCGLMVVTTRNLFHAALWLVGSFFGVAGIYGMLEAEFLAVSQVLIYIGAIATLIIFAAMLTRGMMLGRIRTSNFQAGITAVVAVLLFGLVVMAVLQVDWPTQAPAAPPDTIAMIGQAFVTGYVVPFEIVSVLLLVALVGAIMIAREH
jgi:NADH-quinone oxidoreductase subunit J